MSIRFVAAFLAVSCGALALPQAARAETFNTCAHFIDTVPTTITTQGVYCLRKDLSTAQTSGAAITINTNNVTIDCNDFKLGGLAAGPSSAASGIYAEDRQNIGVRHCNVRGFALGIRINGGAGHLVEDNRLDNNLVYGILVSGEHSRVRRNAVYDTGGATGGISAVGIRASGDIIGNIVEGVYAATSNYLNGIWAEGDGLRVSGNRVSGLPALATAKGIVVVGGHDQTLMDNRVVSGGTSVPGYGIAGVGAAETFCMRNTVAGFTTPITDCQDYAAGSNAAH